FEQIGWKDALLIGAFQVFSLFPGVSRSGATITGGMVRNLDRPAAARFSFLMSIPVMLAAGTLATIDLVQIPHVLDLIPTVLVGVVVAGIVGYLSIRWLLGYLARRPMYYFAIYCLLAGSFMLVVHWMGRA
ncbi:MAG: undecaprenyl-diphosphate phosphatase, partial [Chloroflexota bacterium]